MLQKLLPAFIAALLTGCSAPTDTRWNAGVTSGYGIGDRIVIPTTVHIGCELNEPLGIDKNLGTLTLNLEAYHHRFIAPETGSLIGAAPMLRYSYPLGDFSPYLEGGAGPGYLTIRTKEQGPPGFNFLDQGGFGIDYHIDDLTFTLGYRCSHISHARLRNGPNGGIDEHIIRFGLSIDF